MKLMVKSVEARNGNSAFTLVEIMIVMAIIGLLAAVAVPNFIHAGTTTRVNAILNNLRVIEGAKEQWAIETGQVTGAMPDMTMLKPYFLHDVHPVAGETYIPNALGTAAVAQLPAGSGLPPYPPGGQIQAP